jgi:hypothetical protein
MQSLNRQHEASFNPYLELLAGHEGDGVRGVGVEHRSFFFKKHIINVDMDEIRGGSQGHDPYALSFLIKVALFYTV